MSLIGYQCNKCERVLTDRNLDSCGHPRFEVRLACLVVVPCQQSEGEEPPPPGVVDADDEDIVRHHGHLCADCVAELCKSFKLEAGEPTHRRLMRRRR